MKSIPFKGSKPIGENQPQYNVLHGLKYDTDFGELATCWKATWKERIRFLLTGKMWLWQLTFRGPITPVKLTLDSPELEEAKQ